MAQPKSVRKKKANKVHTVKAELSIHSLSKAGSSLALNIYAHKEKLGEMWIGRGSLFWFGAKRQKRKRISWTRFAEVMDELAYGSRR